MHRIKSFGSTLSILHLVIILISTTLVGCNKDSDQISTETYRTITDMSDRNVRIKNNVNSAVIMEWEGLATKSMKSFGLEDKIVGVDNYAKKNPFRSHVVPVLKDVPDVGSVWSGLNIETLAKINPDVVFMELWVTNESEIELHESAINKIEGLGIPVITFISPSCHKELDIKTAWEHISIVGEVFNKQKEAKILIDRINTDIELIKSRTSKITESEKANVAIFATSNYVMGTKSIQSYFLTEILNANNVVDSGDFVQVSEEQLINLDPEVMIVNGHDGYLDTDVIYQGKHSGINWGNVRDIRALKNKRVISLGYEEWRATFETPVALLKMAKAIYPDRFSDIDIEAKELEMYMTDYSFAEEEAREAISAQKYTGSLEIK